MVAQARHAAAFLCALAFFGAILSACSDETQIAGLDDGVQLHIGVAPDSIAASWILVRPDGTEIAGQGGALVPASEAGEYWLLWEPVPGWDPPVVNPALYLHEDGYAGDIVGQYRRLSGSTGTLRIEAGEPGTGPTWNLTGPDNFFAAGRGSRTLPRRQPGDYSLSWATHPVDELVGSDSDRLQADGTLIFRASMDLVTTETGTIVVDPKPRWTNAPWTLESQHGSLLNGKGYTVITGADADIWTMTWGSVEGFVTPPASQVRVQAGATLYWSFEYLREPGAVGISVVDPEPAGLDAPWVLESEDGIRLTGSGAAVMQYMPPGIWTMRWQPVPGYITPPQLQTVLQVGKTVRWFGEYLPSSSASGSVVIDPEPDSIDAPWTMVSEFGGVFTGRGDSVLVDMPAGQYTLTWGEVAGYNTPTPNPVVKILAPGEAATFVLN